MPRLRVAQNHADLAFVASVTQPDPFETHGPLAAA